eukprot:CAMPEP_0118801138 /NCGR_PEP_ID=MMETSP1161-20130426/2798_1 /TAXON_ID=249345 /ORGANISM="Picochlorum oklahomensis, Strain CCMP2329" /LENGTH=803 /DNA_ID=CAMNT_0006729039 /DNA_START=57 /DNA_END=2468 /DNA_ORIENTATION=+
MLRFASRHEKRLARCLEYQVRRWSTSAENTLRVAQLPSEDEGKPTPPGGQEGPSRRAADAASKRTDFRQPIGGNLQAYGRDLTEDAEKGILDPLIGREDVLERTLQVLLRRTKNNPVLVGDPGVGKTAVAEGIAQLMVSDACPRALKGCSLVALDIGSLVSGTQYRGTFEERLQGILKDVRRSQGRILLFVDEIHMLMDTGKTDGGLNAANLLKPPLAQGELHLIGATTIDEHRKYVESDAAFSRRLQPVFVEEPTPIECLAWLQGLRPKYEEHHFVRYTDEALSTAVTAAQRFVSNRKLPDSAIDLLDEAASRVQLKIGASQQALTSSLIPSQTEKKKVVVGGAVVQSSKGNALSCPHCGTVAPSQTHDLLQITCQNCGHVYLNIAPEKLMMGSSLFLKKQRSNVELNVDNKKESNVQTDESKTQSTMTDVYQQVTKEDILHVAATASGLPVDRLMTVLSEGRALQTLENDLKRSLVGQPQVITGILNNIRMGTMLAAPGKRKRPISILLFRGSQGVGKKTASRTISESLFGSENAFISYDMSMYSDRTATNKLIGAAAGFIGYGDGGTLTEAVRKHPHSVILLENIERCHQDIVALVRQIAREGYITDGSGRKIDFRNTVVVLTTATMPGTSSSTATKKSANSEIKEEASETSSYGHASSSALEMSPSTARSTPHQSSNPVDELRDYIDATLAFENLSRESLISISQMEVESSKEVLALCGLVSVDIDPHVYEALFPASLSPGSLNGHDAQILTGTHIIEPILKKYNDSTLKEPNGTEQQRGVRVTCPSYPSMHDIVIDLQ